jgi:hypothetical protein
MYSLSLMTVAPICAGTIIGFDGDPVFGQEGSNGHALIFISKLTNNLLPGCAERVGKRLGKGAALDGFGSFFNVVFKPDKLDLDAILIRGVAVVVDMEQNITAAGVAVLGLSHGADVDGMAIMGRRVGNGGEDAMVGLMGMAKAHYIGVGVVHDPQ